MTDISIFTVANHCDSFTFTGLILKFTVLPQKKHHESIDLIRLHSTTFRIGVILCFDWKIKMQGEIIIYFLNLN